MTETPPIEPADEPRDTPKVCICSDNPFEFKFWMTACPAHQEPETPP